MASSSTEICNEALARLGEASISSIDDNSVAARACKLHYEPVRDKLLRSHRWNFATTRAVLSQLSPAPLFGWDYQYQIPADCLRVLDINDTADGDVITDEWVVEGTKILSNADTINLVYIARIETVGLFDDLFADALSCKLAVRLSESVRGTTGKTAELLEIYEQIIAPLARRTDANEGRRRRGLLPTNSLAVRARFTGE